MLPPGKHPYGLLFRRFYVRNFQNQPFHRENEPWLSSGNKTGPMEIQRRYISIWIMRI